LATANGSVVSGDLRVISFSNRSFDTVSQAFRTSGGTAGTELPMGKSESHLQAGYDQVAEQYATEYIEELARKPFDCQLLDEFTNSVSGAGDVCELGCGPGQVARYLKDRGVNMRGIDLSLEMVRVARRLNSDIAFEQGDMLALNLEGESLAALVLFYSIIHIKRFEYPTKRVYAFASKA
jgi:predicted TPR repeat methyltransferase